MSSNAVYETEKELVLAKWKKNMPKECRDL